MSSNHTRLMLICLVWGALTACESQYSRVGSHLADDVCIIDGDCPSGHGCRDGICVRYGTGEACGGEAGACASGLHCQLGVCCALDTACCASDEDCSWGHSCDLRLAACVAACSGLISGECGADAYCYSGGCVPRHALGEMCLIGEECASGNCIEGVCCESACGETCASCRQSLTGVDDGTCAPIGIARDDETSSEGVCISEGLGCLGDRCTCDGSGIGAAHCRGAGGSTCMQISDCVSPACTNGTCSYPQLGGPGEYDCLSGTCKPVGPGYYSPDQDDLRYPCSAGFYCASNNNASASGDGPCAAGYYCPPGSTSPTGAGSCRAGYYCPQGSASETGAGRCPDDTYSLSGASSCTPCPTHSRALGSGGSDHNELADCKGDAGYYNCQTGTCATAGAGYYSPPDDNNRYRCAAGYYCSSSTNETETGDGPCLSGYSCPPGSLGGHPKPAIRGHLKTGHRS